MSDTSSDYPVGIPDSLANHPDPGKALAEEFGSGSNADLGAVLDEHGLFPTGNRKSLAERAANRVAGWFADDADGI